MHTYACTYTHQYLAHKILGIIWEAIREHVVQFSDLLKAQILIAIVTAAIIGPHTVTNYAHGAWNGGLPDSS